MVVKTIYFFNNLLKKRSGDHIIIPGETPHPISKTPAPISLGEGDNLNQKRILYNSGNQRYIGQLNNKGLPSGKGMLYEDNGMEQLKYVGTFKNANPHGDNIQAFDFKDGQLFKCYQGAMHNGLKEGLGKEFNFVGHTTYEGNFYKNKYHGLGDLYWDNTVPKYKGNFYHGKFNGEGIAFNKDGGWKEFEGNFRNGKLSGDECIRYLSGEKWLKGSFLDGKQEGHGIEYWIADGTIMKEGMWVGGHPVKDNMIMRYKGQIEQGNGVEQIIGYVDDKEFFDEAQSSLLKDEWYKQYEQQFFQYDPVTGKKIKYSKKQQHQGDENSSIDVKSIQKNRSFKNCVSESEEINNDIKNKQRTSSNDYKTDKIIKNQLILSQRHDKDYSSQSQNSNQSINLSDNKETLSVGNLSEKPLLKKKTSETKKIVERDVETLSIANSTTDLDDYIKKNIKQDITQNSNFSVKEEDDAYNPNDLNITPKFNSRLHGLAQKRSSRVLKDKSRKLVQSLFSNMIDKKIESLQASNLLSGTNISKKIYELSFII